MIAQIDLISANGQGTGDVAQQLISGGRVDVGRMRPWFDPKTGRSYISVHTGGDLRVKANWKNVPINNNATLRRDEWKHLDEAVIRVARERLKGVEDLKSRGLTYNLNGMGSTVLEYHDVSEALKTTISMDGVTRGQNDGVVFSPNYLPLPIVHVDYELNDRVLNVSRTLGQPLDTTLAEQASRRIAETLEDFLFTDKTYAYGGGTIYSYVNHPDRNMVSGLTAWTASAKTAEGIRDDVLEMKQKALDNKHYGPWVLYIPTAYETVLDEDYDDTRGNTIRQRLMAIEGIAAIKTIDKLPANNILLVEMTSEVVRWINGMDVQNVQWSQEGGMIHKFKVMTIQVPQIRSDQEGNSGLIHMAASH